MQNRWKIESREKNVRLKNPILVEGMPGIGNVVQFAAEEIFINESRIKIQIKLI